MAHDFPADFIWGAATSAYQIEGGRTDGKGESIWDRFVHTPGKVLGGATGDVACDHYHRMMQDVGLMADLGVDGYRFSIAWTRVIPDGDGEINPAGLAFYGRLVDALLDAGITPYPTLYHWDLPQALEDKGGWRNRATADAFARFADLTSAALGDRVSTWMTHNEPWVAAFAGNLEGVHAPGLKDWNAALTTAHHLLLSHGLALQRIRANTPDADIGIALDCRPAYPATDSPDDAAAQHHFDGFRNRWFFDPVFGRGYPQDMITAYAKRGRFSTDGPAFALPGDMETIGQPIDFLGINYYTSLPIRAGSDETEATGVEPGIDPPPGFTEMGWPITPGALTDFLVRIDREYSPARIFITENGASFSDGPVAGRIADERRISYLDQHLEAVQAARERGVPVDGYFVWSLLDNFEWSLGYSQRFGLIWVDHDTGERIPKDSYHWYQQVVS